MLSIETIKTYPSRVKARFEDISNFREVVDLALTAVVGSSEYKKKPNPFAVLKNVKVRADFLMYALLNPLSQNELQEQKEKKALIAAMAKKVEEVSNSIITDLVETWEMLKSVLHRCSHKDLADLKFKLDTIIKPKLVGLESILLTLRKSGVIGKSGIVAIERVFSIHSEFLAFVETELAKKGPSLQPSNK